MWFMYPSVWDMASKVLVSVQTKNLQNDLKEPINGFLIHLSSNFNYEIKNFQRQLNHFMSFLLLAHWFTTPKIKKCICKWNSKWKRSWNEMFYLLLVNGDGGASGGVMVFFWSSLYAFFYLTLKQCLESFWNCQLNKK